jgi:hypothetical protein
MTKFPNSPNFQMGAWNQKWVARQKGALHKTPRHPERSEAKASSTRSGLTRAQSKDLAGFFCDPRSGINSLHAGSALRQRKEMPSPNATPTGWTTRSFDSGSAMPFGKTPAPLAFAQDDGFFKAQLSFIACVVKLDRLRGSGFQ